MTRPTVRRRDINLTEEVEEEVSLTGVEQRYRWIASVYGKLSTDETIDIGREGKTAAEALANLEAAIAEQGWGIS